MDITHNLFYHSVDGELITINSKGKEQKYKVTNDISIYDIITAKSVKLFSDTLKEAIRDFYFESHYQASSGRMLYNQHSDGSSEWNKIIGNINIKERKPADKIFILTYSYTTDKFTMWSADKKGTGLKRIHQFSDDTDYYFDVKNLCIRFVKQVGKQIEILDIKY
jgi:hypothetical protein